MITKFTGGYALVMSSGTLLFLGYAMRFVAEAFGPLRSAVETLDPRQEESARLLGGFDTRFFRLVILPLLQPGIRAAFLITFLAVLKELPITLILGEATGMRGLAFRIWDRYSESLWHDAGVSALLLIALALIMTMLSLKGRTNA